MWVARADKYLCDIDLSPKFKDVRECSDYIEKELKVLEYCIRQLDNQYFALFGKWSLKFNNYIRPYNLNQKRFADGFDF